jgi:hypothetical protein
MRYKVEMWRMYTGRTRTKGKNPKPGKLCPVGGTKWGMENSILFNILAQMGKMRNIVYKEAFKLP